METNLKPDVSASYFAKKQRNAIQEGDKKLKNIKKNFEKKEEILKANHLEQMDQILSRHDLEKMEAIENKENRLKKIKDSYDQTKNAIDRAKAQVEKVAALELENKKQLSKAKLEQEIFDNQADLEQFNFRAKRTMDKIREKANSDIQDKKVEFGFIKNELEALQDNQLIDQRNNFRRINRSNQNRYRRTLSSQENEFNQKLTDQRESLEKEIETRDMENKVKLKQMENDYKNAMLETKKSFLQNYSSLKERQEQYYKNLEDLGNKKINQLTNANTEKLKTFTEKKEDKFYHSVDLNPEVKDKEKHYEISFKVSDYEKPMLNLSAYDRKVRVTFSRQFKEEGRDPSGFFQKTQKSESILNEFSLPQIMDSKNITKEYSDGKVTFKVPKK